MSMPLDFSTMVTSAQAGEVLKPVTQRMLLDPSFEGFPVPVEPWTPRPFDGWFHPSTQGAYTLRQLYLYLTRQDVWDEERMDLTGVLAVTAGKFWHKFLQMLWLDDGVMVRDEYEIRVPDINVTGHVDGMLKNGDACEIKSINEFQIHKIDNEIILREKKPGYWCLPTDITEVLTPQGWRWMREIAVGDPVASWDADTSAISFAPTRGVVPAYESNTVMVGDIEMTPDHRIYMRTPHGVRVIKADEAQAVHSASPYYMPTCGHYDGPGLGIDPDLLRLLAWVQADGSFKRLRKGGPIYGLRFHFSKQRKVERVIELLLALGAKFSVTTTKSGTKSIYVSGKRWMDENILCWIPDKQLTWRFLEMNYEEFKIFQDEVYLADGYINETKGLDESPKEYYSVGEQNADVLQALLVLNGASARKASYGGTYRVYEHSRRTQGRLIGGSYREGRRQTEVSCLTTVDGTLLVRQAGHVRVVGNCQSQDYLDATGREIMRYFNIHPAWPFPMTEFTVKADKTYQAKRRAEYRMAKDLADRVPDGSAVVGDKYKLPVCCAPRSKQAKQCPARFACPIGQMR